MDRRILKLEEIGESEWRESFSQSASPWYHSLMLHLQIFHVVAGG